MLFANDLILIYGTRVGLNSKLEQLRHALEFRGFKLSRAKTEYLKCGFTGVKGSGEEVTMEGVTIPSVEKFKYLGLIIDEEERY